MSGSDRLWPFKDKKSSETVIKIHTEQDKSLKRLQNYAHVLTSKPNELLYFLYWYKAVVQMAIVAFIISIPKLEF
jgi:hypothetical protein